ncbi:transcriptional regulator, AraC family [Saccharopolyspora shandongensis]|uniref:Transcriptional regulator, AraC family n=1 Tax=Saccharopolyspora shandongensis TaxID=418495 RepID=A0A1H2QRD5_9PSEU|nr:helix-turn-helix transcriptional regulator [Saccharopolyspora shandongensis]SDW09009.1 transcriptional regulator, AraC family [Saccharopolyspora shandongensis]
MTAETAADHRTAAVLRSIRCIRQNVGDAHLLPDLAQTALLSPFHFHRVFRRVTSATPARFLAAARMVEAKRLLARTPMSVTDICMRVGYSSLGTFTTQFTRLVGVPPRRFRKLLEPYADQPVGEILGRLSAVLPEPVRAQVAGWVSCAPDGALAAVGLFRSGIPQEVPAACAIVRPPGIAALGGLPDGDFHALAMSFDLRASVADALIGEDEELCHVGAAPQVVQIRDGRAVAAAPLRIQLRPQAPVDPPLVLATPILLAADLLAPAG